jgi:hypothetical protein
MDSPLVQGAFALLAGNFVGTIADRVVTLIDKRVSMLDSLRTGSPSGSLLDSLLGVFMHMGVLSLGTEFSRNSLSFLETSPSSFMLFTLGIYCTSGHLISHLHTLNALLFDEKLTPPTTEEAPASSAAVAL